MENEKHEKPHWNLYYIFQQDHQEHLLSQASLQHLMQTVAAIILKKEATP